MTNSRVHVIGAGLAGLAAAVRLASTGCAVTLYEAAPQAGGRCRSYVDRALGCTIDNGNHLLLSGNRDARAYLRVIGAEDRLIGPDEAAFPFVDLGSGAHWVIRINPGRFPWWLWVPSRRIPGVSLLGHVRAWRLARAAPEASLADVIPPHGPLWTHFFDPLATAVLNTPAAAGSAALLWAAIRESFGTGGAGCRPLVARDSLAETFVAPALAFLGAKGAEIRFGARLRRLATGSGRVQALDFDQGPLPLGGADRVILAVPAPRAVELVPGLDAPDRHHAIVNAHYRLPKPLALPEGSPLLGVVGSEVQWIFVRGPLLSLTVSAADALAEAPAEVIARRLWAETVRALALDPTAALPVHRIVKEKRATFQQTPAQVRRRPGPETAFANLVLAGDWTDTGLPATIEGAVRSGHRAADLTWRPPDRAGGQQPLVERDLMR